MQEDHDRMVVVLHLHHETEKALLVSENGNRGNGVWFPKSLCREYDVDRKRKTVEINAPLWWLKENGIV